MIYLWTVPENYANKKVGMYNDETSPNRFEFIKGTSINNEELTTIPEIDFEVTLDKLIPYDCLPNNTLVPIVNHRLKT